MSTLLTDKLRALELPVLMALHDKVTTKSLLLTRLQREHGAPTLTYTGKITIDFYVDNGRGMLVMDKNSLTATLSTVGILSIGLSLKPDKWLAEFFEIGFASTGNDALKPASISPKKMVFIVFPECDAENPF